jgi:hypothetical protein
VNSVLRRVVCASALLLSTAVIPVFGQPPAGALQRPTACPNRVSISNGSFETPVLGTDTWKPVFAH